MSELLIYMADFQKGRVMLGADEPQVSLLPRVIHVASQKLRKTILDAYGHKTTEKLVNKKE